MPNSEQDSKEKPQNAGRSPQFQSPQKTPEGVDKQQISKLEQDVSLLNERMDDMEKHTCHCNEKDSDVSLQTKTPSCCAPKAKGREQSRSQSPSKSSTCKCGDNCTCAGCKDSNTSRSSPCSSKNRDKASCRSSTVTAVNNSSCDCSRQSTTCCSKGSRSESRGCNCTGSVNKSACSCTSTQSSSSCIGSNTFARCRISDNHCQCATTKSCSMKSASSCHCSRGGNDYHSPCTRQDNFNCCPSQFRACDAASNHKPKSSCSCNSVTKLNCGSTASCAGFRNGPCICSRLNYTPNKNSSCCQGKNVQDRPSCCS